MTDGTIKLPAARTADILLQEFEDETLVYDLNSSTAFCLNETATRVWKSCNGKTSFDEFRRLNGAEFSDEYLLLALGELGKKGLLESRFDADIDAAGFSRRKLIARLGATAIALPLVASVIAPTAANAQSVPCGGPCPPLPNANTACIANTCVLTSCNSGFADCNSVRTDGCEVNINTDRNNCGSCGRVCAGAQTCVNGVCV
jgi:hypothetical protein